MKIIAVIFRTLIGLVFLFSGYVKAIDPLGSTYKFTDYFLAFGMDFFTDLSFPLAILLSATEFLIGLFLLLGIFTSISSWLALLFMGIFTPLTLYLALNNPVSDCGCFGDAIILTNWQTFYKNIFILLFTLVLFFLRNKAQIKINRILEYSLGLVLAFLIVGFEFYNYNHLPIQDFRPYKIGNYLPELMDIPEGMEADEYVNIYNMENTKTGEKKEINSKEFVESGIWKDTTWIIKKTSEESVLIKKGYTPPIHDFELITLDGRDLTEEILDEPFVFLLVAYDLDETNREALKIVNKLAAYCVNFNYSFYGLTSSGDGKINRVIVADGLLFEFLGVDEITLKTMIRANPGLLLLKRGKVIGKWHYRDLPSVTDLEKNYLN